MTTVSEIREERERRQAIARGRAANLAPGDYYADGDTLYKREKGHRTRPVLKCETHIDAVMVMLLAPKP